MTNQPEATTESWTLFYPERPWTVNAERSWHHMKRAKKVKEWREGFCWLARAEKIPPLEYMFIEATPVLADHRLQDVAAISSAVKAAVDGLVDCGVVPDDSNKWLKWIKFYPCVVSKDKTNGLQLTVIGKRS